jgi:hypothetical protein
MLERRVAVGRSMPASGPLGSGVGRWECLPSKTAVQHQLGFLLHLTYILQPNSNRAVPIVSARTVDNTIRFK